MSNRSHLALHIGEDCLKVADQLYSLRAGSECFDSSYRLSYFHASGQSSEGYVPKSVFMDFRAGMDIVAPGLQFAEEDVDMPWSGKVEVFSGAGDASLSLPRLYRSGDENAVALHGADFADVSQQGLDSAVAEKVAEAASDRLRHFAEVSDNVASLDLHFHLGLPFLQLQEKLLDELRVDFGPSVSMPLFLLAEPGQYRDKYQAGLALAYTRYLSCSSVLVPLQRPPAHALSPLAFSAPLYSLLSHEQRNQNLFPDMCTEQRRFPICFMEAFVSKVLQPPHAPPPDAPLPYPALLDYMKTSFNSLDQARTTSVAYSPFAVPLSPVHSLGEERHKMYAHLLTAFGWREQSKGLTRFLYQQCMKGGYHVNGVLETEEEGFLDNRCLEGEELFGSIAGIFASSAVAEQVKEVRGQVQRQRAVQKCLRVLGCEDLKEEAERLMEIEEFYTY